jgi:carbonic anhydrase
VLLMSMLSFVLLLFFVKFDANIRDSLEQSVKDDLAILKSSTFMRKELADRCVGFLYDLKSGALTSVDA